MLNSKSWRIFMVKLLKKPEIQNLKYLHFYHNVSNYKILEKKKLEQIDIYVFL